jgi:acetylornithine deacetylase
VASEVAELARSLVQVESINPELGVVGSGEGAVAQLVREWAERAGLDAELEEPAPGRPNVIVTARGRGGGRTLLLNGHMDTVSTAGMAEPFSGRIEGDRLYGRGSYDMKGALAACLVACERSARAGLRGDVVVTAVSDEEVASVGTTAIAATRTAQAAIVAEPTEERIGVAHRGFAGFRIVVAGRAAHGSRADLGIDAIALTGPVLVRLHELDARLRANAGHPLLGPGSMHASLISGGQEYSSYPASCELVGERRTIPGERPEDVATEVTSLLGDIDASWEPLMARDPFEIDRDDPLVEAVARHAGDPERIGLPFWTDAALLQAAGIPTVLYGPVGEGAHAEVEWVDLASLERCADVYTAVAAEVCA